MKRLLILSGLLISVSLNSHGQFYNYGNTRFFNGASVTFFGDVTNDGTLADSGTVVTLAGTLSQQIGGTAVTTFKNLKLDNTSVAGVTLAQAMHVGGTMTFTDGHLHTDAVNLLTLDRTASATGMTHQSFVWGPVAKTGNQAFTFPTGDTVYAPIAISAPAVNTDQFTAQYFKVSPNPYNINSKVPALNNVSNCEYWFLDRTNGSSDVAVTLSWDIRSCGVTDLLDLRVAGWDGIEWTDQENGGTTGSIATGAVVSGIPATSFGPFTLSSVSINNPLPIGLISFEASCEGNEVILRWRTASEQQNDYFKIESSLDAINWTSAGEVAGAGNSTAEINYQHTDFSNPGRSMYYRLKQTDLNGKSKVYDPVYVESCQQEAATGIVIYPNPSNGRVNILSETKLHAVSVHDSHGKETTQVHVDLLNKTLQFSGVSQGVYFITITTSTGTFVRRVVIGK